MTTVVVRVKFEIAVKCVTSDITIWLEIFKITNDDDSCTQLSLFVQLSTIVFIRAIAWQQLVVHFVTMVVVMITTVVDIATMVVAYTWCHSSTGIGQLPLVPVVSPNQCTGIVLAYALASLPQCSWWETPGPTNTTEKVRFGRYDDFDLRKLAVVFRPILLHRDCGRGGPPQYYHSRATFFASINHLHPDSLDKRMQHASKPGWWNHNETNQTIERKSKRATIVRAVVGRTVCWKARKPQHTTKTLSISSRNN